MMSGLSTDAFSPAHSGRYLLPILQWLFPDATPAVLGLMNAGIRKAMHVLEFGVLALLWYRALRPAQGNWNAQVGMVAFALSAAFAGVDEFHQTFVPSRTGQLVDVGWDSLGAALALIAYYVFQRVRGRGSSSTTMDLDRL
jgi:VanZ family protein